MVMMGGILTAAAMFLPASNAAQQRAGAFPVIVAFNNNAPFESFRGSYRADDRAAANPAAWNYLDRGVAGLVQALEARQGFRAGHVYSHAIRGFSAHLTAPNMSLGGGANACNSSPARPGGGTNNGIMTVAFTPAASV